jgi:EpsI family protein
MDPQIWERVGGQDYVIIDYSRERWPPINLYVAYYEHQRKAGDFIHSPRLCLPGAGWFIEENSSRRIGLRGNPGQDGRALEINDLLISKAGVRQLVYFWYQGRGRNFTSEWTAKFYMVWDGIFRRRTDGALVRVITPIPPGATAQAARDILDPFAVAASETLEQHLP